MSDPTSANSQPAATPPKREGTGWRKWLLVGSLTLNLAVLGVVGGAMLRGHSDGPRPMAVRDLGFGPFAEALSDEDRRALRKAFVQRAPDLRVARRAMREDMAAVLQALRAEPFAADALQAALRRGSSRAAERQDLGQALIFDHVAAMTPDARRAFAERLEKSLTRKRPRDGERSGATENRKP